MNAEKKRFEQAEDLADIQTVMRIREGKRQDYVSADKITAMFAEPRRARYRAKKTRRKRNR